ncbi:hypothetical protein DKX38_018101 [Salix brachista]|uniref:Uncharacterized protein n=1 Tax=Salix brachista TaxID=2182728 RepID=A0A5N5KX06_9ROSI|nr:hypothetical protein DKX38_018101 [Salix brachista]
MRPAPKAKPQIEIELPRQRLSHEFSAPRVLFTHSSCRKSIAAAHFFFTLSNLPKLVQTTTLHSEFCIVSGTDSYIRGQSISPSTSDNGDLRGIRFSDIPGKFKDLPVKDPVSDILEPFSQTTLGTSSKIPRSTSFEFQSSQSDISFDLGGSNHSVKESSPDTFETTGEHQAVPVLSRPIVEKSFVLNKRKSNLSKIPLPQSAATFYNGFSPQFEIMESCESTERLNILESQKG